MDIKHLELFLIFNAMVVTLLMLDLFVFHRKNHVVSVKEALSWTAFWISLALTLYGLIYFHYADWVDLPAGRTSKMAAQEFLAGYLIEESLSVDNLFVFLIIFSRFRLPAEYQHKVLFWGILGAIIMRVTFIFAGVELIHRFEWLMYIFGGFLIFTGFKLFKEDEPDVDLEKNPLLQLARRFIPLTTEYSQGKFFAVYNGIRHATPMFLVLILVESTDLLFALDSIPAVLGISDDFLIIYSSNIMAILGLRSLYFALAGIMRYFRYLNLGLAIILIFIGVKMIIAMDYMVEIGIGYKISTEQSLIVVGSILLLAVVASILNPLSKEEGDSLPDALPEEDPDAEEESKEEVQS